MNHILRIGLGAAATINVAATVLYALDRDWTSALFTLALATALTALAILHRPHTHPVPPERGQVAITFEGGPLDGADIPLPHLPAGELLDMTLEVDGARYRITTVHHTCYTAEIETTE